MSTDSEMSPNIAFTASKGHPKGFWFFFWGEFAERCSYYGMRAILPLYLTTRLNMSDEKASESVLHVQDGLLLPPAAGGVAGG